MREFRKVLIDRALPGAETRDAKDLYARARRRQLPNFTGIDSAYEPPEQAELRIGAMSMTPEEAAEHIVRSRLERA